MTRAAISCNINCDCVFQDEQSAVTMLKKHQIVEQAVEDYAETVHQLSKTSRGLVADGHPERYGHAAVTMTTH